MFGICADGGVRGMSGEGISMRSKIGVRMNRVKMREYDGYGDVGHL